MTKTQSVTVLSITDITEVLETNEDTIRKWLAKAAEHSEQVSQKLVNSMSVMQVELERNSRKPS